MPENQILHAMNKDYHLFTSKYLIAEDANLYSAFKRLYAINYLSSRIEVRSTLKNTHYQVTLSCLKESFLLYKDNYIRAASLVLRSAIENYIKFLLSKENLAINDRVYTENYNNLKNGLETNYNKKNIRESLLQLNNKMLSHYKRLSGLSHSLTKESKELAINFFTDISLVHNQSLNLFQSIFLSFLEIVQSINILYSKYSLEHWQTEHILNLLNIHMGAKRSSRFIQIIKQDSDINFHCFENPSTK